MEVEDIDPDEEAKHGEEEHHQQNAYDVERGEQNRVTNTLAQELNHANCVKTLEFNKFDWEDRDLERFHRPNTQEIFIEVKA